MQPPPYRKEEWELCTRLFSLNLILTPQVKGCGGLAITLSRVQGSGLRVQGSGFRVQGSGFRVQGSGLRVQGSGFRVQGSGFRVQGSGFRVQGQVALQQRCQCPAGTPACRVTDH